MTTLTKTIESLRSQCEHLSSLLREDEHHLSVSASASEEVKAMRRELEYAVERASKAERRKRELASELLAQRTKNELVIHELEGKVNQYEVPLLSCLLPLSPLSLPWLL
jgi:acyl-CoA reductase-like NAD-dependent aldehyde dehydrogenase